MRTRFFFGESLDALRRNWVMTIASALTVVVTMAILGVVLVTDKNLTEGTTSLTNRVEIEVFVTGAPPEASAVSALGDKIAGLKQQGIVRNYTYISQAQAWIDLEQRSVRGRNDPGKPYEQPAAGLLQDLREEPQRGRSGGGDVLPRPQRRQRPRHHRRRELRQTDGAQPAGHHRPGPEGHVGRDGAVRPGGDPAHLDHRATVDLRPPSRGRVHAARGRRSWFIRWPFILEGFITGLVGSLIAALAVWGANVLVYNWIHASKLDFLRPIKYPLIVQSGSWPLGLIPTLVLVGAVLGACGSFLALRRYLRV